MLNLSKVDAMLRFTAVVHREINLEFAWARDVEQLINAPPSFSVWGRFALIGQPQRLYTGSADNEALALSRRTKTSD
jgi:hypothetical protein